MTEFVQILSIILLGYVVVTSLRKAWRDGDRPAEEGWLE